jgi:glycyl-tRNA synthetase
MESDECGGLSVLMKEFMLKNHFMTSYDDAGNIGKRYRRGDAIGTPFTVTIDDNTLENNVVTLRDRDTMEQINLNIDNIVDYIVKALAF